jgi:sulfatase maturation enzyme AslB (radical SAM superfamily)
MLDPALWKDFNLFRGASDGTTACPAPLINLHFSQLGVVTACCFNRTQVLGVYPKNSVREIWEGAAAAELRAALARGDLSRGCEKCLQQIQARDFGGSHAVFYTRQAQIVAERQQELGIAPAAGAPGTPLPMKLEFNIHNACNLQCIMCHGLASSSIRTRREGLPPMGNPYDDAFVDQLAPYLPYVVETDFMGGEPFLIPLYHRIWTLIGRVNPATRVCILTNATILDERIKAMLESINCWIHISIDSFRKDTYETIRRGASYDEVMANARYFQELMAARGLPVIWRLCPMRLNWHELPDTLQYCTENGIGLFYNQLDSPIGLSLNTLPAAELAQVVETLQAREPALPPGPLAAENLANYRELVARLRGFLQPENRLASLRARLETSRAVVSQYSKGREAESRKQTAVPMDDALTQAVKNYLITRLNVHDADAIDGALPTEFSQCVDDAERLLAGLRDEVSSGDFVTAYLKELVRTYSGVWGVAGVHENEVFGRVDELVAGLEKEPGRDWGRLLRVPPKTVYEAIGLAASVDGMRRWLADL